MVFRTRCLLASTALALTLSTTAMADEFRLDRLFVVGDSLSDYGTYSQVVGASTGGTAPNIRYQFTNDNLDGSTKTYSGVLADELGIDIAPNIVNGVVAPDGVTRIAGAIPVGGTNFAQGGSRVAIGMDSTDGISQIPVTVQVQRMIDSTPGGFDSTDLVILWAGANDIRENATNPDGLNEIRDAARIMVDQVDRVLEHGATNVVVVTNPDIGNNTPAGTALKANPFTAPVAQNLTDLGDEFNKVLREGVSGRVTLVNANAILEDILADPVRYGFANVDQRALVNCPPDGPGDGSALFCVEGTSPGLSTAVDNGAVFADGIHPAAQTHLVFGQMSAATLVSISQAGVMPVATISALRQQSVGLEQRLNLGAFFVNDDSGQRIARPVGNVEIYGGGEVGFYESDQQQIVPGFDASTQVVKVAADVMVTPNLMLGAGVSLDHGQVDFADDRGGFDSRLVVGGVFGVAQIIRGVYANAFLGGGLIDIYDIDRRFDAGPSRESYEADTDGTYFIARTNLGAVLPVGNGFFVNPSLGIAYERVDIDGYEESATNGSAPSLAAQVGDLEYEGLRGTAALAAFYRPPSAPTWTFGLRASWEHDFNDDDVVVPFAVAGEAQNDQIAPRPDDSYGLLSATIVKELTHSTSASLQGSTNVGQDGVDGYTLGLVFKHTF